MSSCISLTALYFIVSHAGPAEFVATVAESLPLGPIEIFASGPALHLLQQRQIKNVTPFIIESDPKKSIATATEMARRCHSASSVITDVGHPFCITIQEALAKEVPGVRRLAYYDNPEPYVPGGYSETAAKVMQVAEGVLFANARLETTPLASGSGETLLLGETYRKGLGYYPVEGAQALLERRVQEKQKMRQAFLASHQIEDTGQPLIVYFGGNNPAYFEEALPAFLSFLEPAPSSFPALIILQQHPGAKTQDQDRIMIQNWLSKNCFYQPLFLFSELSSTEAQVIADGILYYQTSMAPQFLLAGIPTAQIGHETYLDLLTRSGLGLSITSEDALFTWIHQRRDLEQLPQKIPTEMIYEGLGIRSDWQARFVSALAQ